MDRLPIVGVRGTYLARRDAGWALVVRSDVETAEVDLGCRVLTAEAVARVLGAPVVVEADCVRVCQ